MEVSRISSTKDHILVLRVQIFLHSGLTKQTARPRAAHMPTCNSAIIHSAFFLYVQHVELTDLQKDWELLQLIQSFLMTIST